MLVARQTNVKLLGDAQPPALWLDDPTVRQVRLFFCRVVATHMSVGARATIFQPVQSLTGPRIKGAPRWGGLVRGQGAVTNAANKRRADQEDVGRE
jgi:hypothetical protein